MRVIVGMSGGVDSSVAAYLLKEQGHEVIGVTMDNGIFSSGDAVLVCNHLGIRHETIDFSKEFKEKVIDNFVSEYRSGRTPNPCVVCNPGVKWASLCKCAELYGADMVATGHYASIAKNEDGRYSIKQSQSKKDQSYALYRLTQEQLAMTVFPLGELSKDEVRYIARAANIPVADKPDSQEICFVSDDDHTRYIEEYTGVKECEGNFEDKDGNVLGVHRGISRYTIGQRKGLGISAEKRIFVTNIDPENNRVILGDNEELFKDEFLCTNISYMGKASVEERTEVYAKIRYNHLPAKAYIEQAGDDLIRCVFCEKQRAITPGQSAVFYINGEIALGGFIK